MLAALYGSVNLCVYWDALLGSTTVFTTDPTCAKGTQGYFVKTVTVLLLKRGTQNTKSSPPFLSNAYHYFPLVLAGETSRKQCFFMRIETAMAAEITMWKVAFIQGERSLERWHLRQI